MVTKLDGIVHWPSFEFESCVVLDGDKTVRDLVFIGYMFESCVVLDGDKTWRDLSMAYSEFESCVVLDGDKTRHI